MKQLITILSFILIATITFGQSKKYTKSMSNALTVLKTAATADELNKVASTFEGIAKKEKKEWLPLYYQAYAIAEAGFRVKDIDDKTTMFDKAQIALDKAFELSPEESELFVLQAIIYHGYISTDPTTLSMTYGPRSQQVLSRAVQLNQENPRASLLLGQNLYYMPAAFGGGKKAAMPRLNKAKKLFENYEAPTNFHPTWGKEDLTTFLAEINQ